MSLNCNIFFIAAVNRRSDAGTGQRFPPPPQGLRQQDLVRASAKVVDDRQLPRRLNVVRVAVVDDEHADQRPEGFLYSGLHSKRPKFSQRGRSRAVDGR